MELSIARILSVLLIIILFMLEKIPIMPALCSILRL